MRLEKKEIEHIKNTFLALSKEGKVYLFGSRIDDDKKGGDIDLLFITKTMTKQDVRKFRIEFFKRFGEQKLDIVVDDGSFKNPFTKLIYQKAIEL